MQYYDRFLRQKTSFNEKEYVAPKFIETFYDQMSSALKSQEKRQCILYFIPAFFEAFVKAYKWVSV